MNRRVENWIKQSGDILSYDGITSESGKKLNAVNRSYQANQIFESLDEAGDFMREGLVNHSDEIVIVIDAGACSFDSVSSSVWKNAIKHTGRPDEGDYIQYTFGGWASSYGSYGSFYIVDYTVEYRTSLEQERDLEVACNNLLDSLNLSGNCNYDTICTIYDYVCKNVDYDYDNLDDENYKLKYTAYAALMNKTAVCQGYANLMYRLLLQCGIDCRIVDGGDHAWNIVQLDNTYYFIDATWDSTSGRYYFLKSKAFFDTEHDLDGYYSSYPFTSQYKYATSDFSNTKVHYFGDYTTVENANCTTKGLKKRVCTDCGFTDYTNIIPAGHAFSKEYTIDEESTCSRTGIESRHCQNCDFVRDPVESDTKPHTPTKKTYKATSFDDGRILTICKVCGDVTGSKIIPKISKVKLSTESLTYNGTVRKPTISVRSRTGSVIPKDYYTVTYADGRKNVGKYKVTVKFKTNYSGTFNKYFKINPAGTSVSSLSAVSKGFTVKWKKQATQTSGYQIRYSTSSSMSSSKTVTISKNTTLSKKVTSLKATKKYYVQVRTYKTVNSTKYYSAWSAKKSVTTKR